MTSQPLPPKRLLAEIEQLLAESSPEVDGDRTREILQQMRDYLTTVESAEASSEASSEEAAPDSPPNAPPNVTPEDDWRDRLLQPFQEELDGLRQHRNRLAQEVARLENSASPSTSDPEMESESVSPLLNPEERRQHLQAVQAEADRLLMNLDTNLRTIFDGVTANLQGYETSLTRSIQNIYNFSQQGEAIVAALVRQLGARLDSTLELADSLDADKAPELEAAIEAIVQQPTDEEIREDTLTSDGSELGSVDINDGDDADDTDESLDSSLGDRPDDADHQIPVASVISESDLSPDADLDSDSDSELDTQESSSETDQLSTNMAELEEVTESAQELSDQESSEQELSKTDADLAKDIEDDEPLELPEVLDDDLHRELEEELEDEQHQDADLELLDTRYLPNEPTNELTDEPLDEPLDDSLAESLDSSSMASPVPEPDSKPSTPPTSATADDDFESWFTLDSEPMQWSSEQAALDLEQELNQSVQEGFQPSPRQQTQSDRKPNSVQSRSSDRLTQTEAESDRPSNDDGDENDDDSGETIPQSRGHPPVTTETTRETTRPEISPPSPEPDLSPEEAAIAAELAEFVASFQDWDESELDDSELDESELDDSELNNSQLEAIADNPPVLLGDTIGDLTDAIALMGGRLDNLNESDESDGDDIIGDSIENLEDSRDEFEDDDIIEDDLLNSPQDEELSPDWSSILDDDDNIELEDIELEDETFGEKALLIQEDTSSDSRIYVDCEPETRRQLESDLEELELEQQSEAIAEIDEADEADEDLEPSLTQILDEADEADEDSDPSQASDVELDNDVEEVDLEEVDLEEDADFSENPFVWRDDVTDDLDEATSEATSEVASEVTADPQPLAIADSPPKDIVAKTPSERLPVARQQRPKPETAKSGRVRVPPPIWLENSHHRDWYLGIDWSDRGLSAILSCAYTGTQYWLGWQVEGEQHPLFDIPAIARQQPASAMADFLEKAPSETMALPTWRVGLETRSLSEGIIFDEFEQVLGIMIPWRSRRGGLEPMLGRSLDYDLPLVSSRDILTRLFRQLRTAQIYHPGEQQPAADLPPFAQLIPKLGGVIIREGLSSNDAFRFNVREAALEAGLVPRPDRLGFCPAPLAALLSALDASSVEFESDSNSPSDPPSEPELSSPPTQSPSQSWSVDFRERGSTLVMVVGARDMALAPFQLNSESTSQLPVPLGQRGLAYGHRDFADDLLIQLMLTPNPDWCHELGVMELQQLPRCGAADRQHRIALQQWLDADEERQAVRELARQVLAALQLGDRTDFELAGRWQRIHRSQFDETVLVPFFEQLNQDFNQFLSELGLSVEGISRVLLTGDSANGLLDIAPWLNHKLPNAVVVTQSPPSALSAITARNTPIATGLAQFLHYPLHRRDGGQQYSDFFLLRELLETVPDQPLSRQEAIARLELRGIHTGGIESRITTLLHNQLPPGLIPTPPQDEWLTPESQQVPFYGKLATTPLFEFFPESKTYQIHRPLARQLLQYLNRLTAETRQSFSEPLSLHQSTVEA